MMDDTDSDKENETESEFPEVANDVPVKWMTSKKGKNLLVDPFNYVYTKMKDYKGKTFWRCQRCLSKVLPR
jgi:hypothetical protein